MKNIPRIALVLLLALLSCGCGKDAEPVPAGQRVVSLAPSLTEILCALDAGESLVGRTSVCNYPPSVVTNVLVIGDFGRPSLELLLTVMPSLVLDVDLADETIGHRIDALGLRRERVKCDRLSDIPPAVTAVGAYLGREDAARKLAHTLSAGIEQCRRRVAAATDPPNVFVEIWGDPITTAGRESFVSELIALAGGRNIGDEVKKPYFQVSSEWVVSRDPDVILCLYMSSSRPARQAVLSRSGWSDVAAVRSGRVYDGLNNDVILRPGPRVLDGIEQMRQCILGESGSDE